MKNLRYLYLALFLIFAGCDTPAPPPPPVDHVAAKPLFRDPVYDGAADPTIIYHAADKKWYMLYTNRRANVEGLGNGVAWVHGTPIGIATSADGGATWEYAGQAKINYPGAVAEPTWWAPAVVVHDGVYHMYLSYVPGVFNDWRHPRDIIHLTSKDLINWDYQSTLPLASHSVIDAGVLHLPDGTWRLWYKDEANGSSCHYADSKDLYNWTDGARVPGLSDTGGEAPNPFHWQGHYWLLRDITGGRHGLGLYRSDDAVNWQRVGTLLQEPGTGPDDTAVGHHPEVILSGDRAYMFYFTQFGKRTTIQVTELKYDAVNNTLTCDRDAPTLINLQPPKAPDTESKFN
ncbi:MAG TPA: glycosyl hydrolase [Opitutales bacterium]|nr:glycosyl hydrolase [Opitutales bacterium]